MNGAEINQRIGIKQGIGMVQIARELAKRGRTLQTLFENPKVRLTKGELTAAAVSVRGDKPFNEALMTNAFANASIQQAVGGNKVARILFRSQQLKTTGLTGVIHGNKPAVLDLEPFYMLYLGSCKDLEAKVIQLDVHDYIKPEDIKMKEQFDMGDGLEAVFKTNDGDRLLMTASALFADNSSSEIQRVPFSGYDQPVEVKGLILQGKDNGNKLEVSAKFPFTGQRTIVIPMLTPYYWINLAPIRVEYKRN